jgi:transaldolase
MGIAGFVHHLKSRNTDSEVWFDSSPAIYPTFKVQLLKHYPGMSSLIDELLPDQLLPSALGISGVTTNPVLISQAVLENTTYCNDYLETLHGHLPIEDRVRQLYDRMIVDGAHQLRTLWNLSGHRQGWLSAQIEGGHWMSRDALVARGLELAALAPNVMIKIPGSEQGYQAIEHLVARGCSINNTFCFTVSQVDAFLKALHAGQQRARVNGVSTQDARHVVSFMIGRLGAEGEFGRQARDRRIELTRTDTRWAELAVYQAMQALMRRRQTSARLLLCSIKVDVDARGREHCWHLQRTGAGTTVYTLTPQLIEFLVRRAQDKHRILPASDWVQIPQKVLNRLVGIPYFNQAYHEEGLSPAGFASHPAFVNAGDNVRRGLERLHDFVAAGVRQPDIAQRQATARPTTSRSTMEGLA